MLVSSHVRSLWGSRSLVTLQIIALKGRQWPEPVCKLKSKDLKSKQSKEMTEMPDVLFGARLLPPTGVHSCYSFLFCCLKDISLFFLLFVILLHWHYCISETTLCSSDTLNTCHFQQPLYRKYQKSSFKVSLITKWLQMCNIIVYSWGYSLSNLWYPLIILINAQSINI